MLASPPILARSVLGKPIFVYISVSDNGVSSIIIQEEEGEQRPIYYVNKVLQGVELRYQKIEKATLIIVITARKLRPYFESHPVIYRINLPIKKILRKPKLARRMLGWVVELSKFVTYERRGHMKAQLLTNFINELTPNSHEEESMRANREWTLSVDDNLVRVENAKCRMPTCSRQRLIRSGLSRDGSDRVLAKRRLSDRRDGVRLTPSRTQMREIRGRIRLPRRSPWKYGDGSPMIVETLRIGSTRVQSVTRHTLDIYPILELAMEN
ncbi:hypothetical protein CR513_40612, partial [Mucuna pruriens]